MGEKQRLQYSQREMCNPLLFKLQTMLSKLEDRNKLSGIPCLWVLSFQLSLTDLEIQHHSKQNHGRLFYRNVQADYKIYTEMQRTSNNQSWKTKWEDLHYLVLGQMSSSSNWDVGYTGTCFEETAECTNTQRVKCLVATAPVQFKGQKKGLLCFFRVPGQ